jgi:Hemolysin-type calcium-binding repeat (2 copies).
MMRPSTVVRLLVLAAAFLVLASGSFAFTAANTVPATNAGTQTFTIDANALKPASCASLNLSAIVTNNNPGNASELILGTAAADTINGKSGDDCILGGGGNDSITGGPGTDVCIGGPGTDTFASCETQTQ